MGDRQLADYAYYSGNGNLMCMSYGLTDSGLATYSYWYDKLDRVTRISCFDADTETEISYGYRYNADGNLSGITEAGKLKYTYEYDSLGRLIYSSRLDNGNTVLYTKHQYDTSDRLTNQRWQIGNDAFSESYTYSTKDGTLTSMTTGGDSLGFTYNNLKQLSKQTSPKLDVAYSYRTRDEAGKLTTNQVETVQYLQHGTTTIRNLTYDIIGNPLSYFNGKADWTFTWKNGRQLSTATNGSTSITNTYDADGIRETKTVNGVKHTYTYLGEKLARETYESNVIDYFYDSDGRPYKLVIKEGTTSYTGYFALNLQGDVIAIIDSNGAVAVEYEYDAWGKEIAHTTSGSYGSKLYSYNVLKYRGYYYDAEPANKKSREK